MRRLSPLPFLLATIAASFPSASVAAQDAQITLDRCREPKEPLGQFDARGVVRGELGSTGRVDTATVTVGSVSGMSASGFRSAVRRQLSGCTFKVSPKHSDAIPILQQLVFDSGRARVSSIPASRGTFTPIELSPASLPDTSTIWPDSLVEEHPRRLDCKGSGNAIRHATTVVTSATDLERLRRDLEDRHSGLVHFTFVLGPDGRFVDGSSAVVSATTPSLTQDAIAFERTCRYTPGRIQGALVAVRVDRRIEARVKIE